MVGVNEEKEGGTTLPYNGRVRLFFVSSCGGVSIGCNLVFIAEQMGGEPVEGYAANFRVVHARDVPDILASQGGEDATVEESVTYGKHSLVVVVFEEVAEKLGGTDVECPNTFGVGREVSLESLGLGERDACSTAPIAFAQ